MADYRAPVDDLRFALHNVGDLAGLAKLPGYGEAEPELVDQILEEAGRVANEVWAPINRSGDLEGVKLDNGVVRTAKGFADAYQTYVDSGFNTLAFDPDYGGQGLPWTLALGLMELWNAANMSLALNPLLTIGAVELLQTHGTQAQRDTYLPKLISGQWTGTMNLSEPEAGTDVGALKTHAERAEDGSYRITGQKIYITWGEHDMAENIVHMVLARLPDAPAGTKGISLFLVPKFIPDNTGEPGRRNDVRCVSLEHKLGIHACATCTLAFGDDEGAVGLLVGEENGGMKAMFTMMNNARLAVGVQGVAIAERAYQDARAWAFDRIQSRDIRGSKQSVPIVRHPDVRRMLLEMRSRIEAGRALALYAGNALDRAKQAPDADDRATAQSEVDLLVPVVKAWCTDMGVEVSSLAIQVHGGMGFIEESGVCQHYRDARIAPIYEGTNGVQALDLMGRKVLRDDGAAAMSLIGRLRQVLDELDQAGGDPTAAIRENTAQGLDALESATQALLELGRDDLAKAAAVATPYLQLFGTVAGGALLAKQAAAAARQLGTGAQTRRDVLQGKLGGARYYAANVMPRAQSLLAEVRQGADSTLELDETLF